MSKCNRHIYKRYTDKQRTKVTLAFLPEITKETCDLVTDEDVKKAVVGQLVLV